MPSNHIINAYGCARWNKRRKKKTTSHPLSIDLGKTKEDDR